jgi:NAD(P)-dependent dehydrogenase (short-subunit alcohol dehydrogenase family)
MSTKSPTPGRHSGRVALVTGGASGIGAGTVRRLAADGARVVIADVQGSAAEAVAKELGSDVARWAAVDVTREEDVRAAVDLAVQDFGRLDVVFANAGILGATGSILNASVADAERTIAVDLIGTYITTKQAARVMVAQGSGVIISTSSPAGVSGGVGPHAYSAAKAGIIGLMRSVAGELRPRGIRVNAIVPGSIVSAMTADIELGDATALDRAHEALAAQSPLGRPGLPSDIAAAVSFLASDEAAFITGHVLAVDAGFTSITGNSPFTTGEWEQARTLYEAGRRG